jgi:hypothetical protein
MKRWYIVGEFEYVCSLQSLAGRSKIAQFKSDNGDNLIVQFFKLFDFSRAKEGIGQTAWLKIHGDEGSNRCKIVFK